MIKRIPWWAWIIGIVMVLFLINYASSFALNRSLFNMALDQLREDKTAILERLEKDKEARDKIITDLQKKMEIVQKQRAAAEAESEKLRGLVREKDAQIFALKKEREAIIVSGDPDALVAELHRMGFKSARVIRNP